MDIDTKNKNQNRDCLFLKNTCPKANLRLVPLTLFILDALLTLTLCDLRV